MILLKNSLSPASGWLTAHNRPPGREGISRPARPEAAPGRCAASNAGALAQESAGRKGPEQVIFLNFLI